MSLAWRAVGPDETDLSVRATPGAGKDALAGVVEGALLLRFLGKEVLGVPPSRLVLMSGERGRNKVIRIPLPLEEVARRIEARLATE